MTYTRWIAAVGVVALFSLTPNSRPAGAADWPQWGGTTGRNMVSAERGLPDLLASPAAGESSLHDMRGVRWSARVGYTTAGTPTIAGGRVFVGTAGAKCGLLLCLDEKTGRFLWQLRSPWRDFIAEDAIRPAAVEPKSPWDYLLHGQSVRGLGFTGSPAVDGNEVYTITPRGEVVCLDVRGIANGNQGRFSAEDAYQTADGRGAGYNGADVLWLYDLWKDLQVRPADTFHSSILVHGDYLYLGTSNGVDLWPEYYPRAAAACSPAAPSLIVLHKRTGRLVAHDVERIGTRVLHGQWSSPSLGVVAGRTLIFYGGGDGVCYAFEPPAPPAALAATTTAATTAAAAITAATTAAAAAATAPAAAALRKVWSFDCNPPQYNLADGRKPLDYRLGDRDLLKSFRPADANSRAWHEARCNRGDGAFLGLSEIIATPVFHNGRVYVATGRDPRHGRGRGALHCIDASGTGDITASGRVWTSTSLDRTLSTVSIADGLLYVADVAGRIHCLDADTGRTVWVHETNQETWASTLVADGRVYLPTRSTLWVLAAGREKNILGRVPTGGPWTPVAANGTLYLATHSHLLAFGPAR